MNTMKGCPGCWKVYHDVLLLYIFYLQKLEESLDIPPLKIAIARRTMELAQAEEQQQHEKVVKLKRKIEDMQFDLQSKLAIADAKSVVQTFALFVSG